MADYREKLDEWQQAARRKARELDEKYSISDLVGEGARAAGDAARRGAETVADGAERLRAEAERLTDEDEVGETARRAASETVKTPVSHRTGEPSPGGVHVGGNATGSASPHARSRVAWTTTWRRWVNLVVRRCAYR